jgi:hypothetical protein
VQADAGPHPRRLGADAAAVSVSAISDNGARFIYFEVKRSLFALVATRRASRCWTPRAPELARSGAEWRRVGAAARIASSEVKRSFFRRLGDVACKQMLDSGLAQRATPTTGKWRLGISSALLSNRRLQNPNGRLRQRCTWFLSPFLEVKPTLARRGTHSSNLITWSPTPRLTANGVRILRYMPTPITASPSATRNSPQLPMSLSY